MFPRRALLLCLVVCTAVACKTQAATAPGSSAAAAKPGSGAATPAAAQGASSGKRADLCPVKVPATAVTVLNTRDGVAMYFTTLGSYVDELRRRTKALAQAATPQQSQKSAGDRDNVELAPWEIMARSGIVPLHVTEEDIPDGSRLVLVPTDPDDLDGLRSYARAHAERMRLGDCAADFLTGRSKATAEAASSDTHS